ncbi:Arc family DNA-binding protein [Hyphomicrobium sp. 1Nfss2.1]|uniref:Arc family DNA-binding protein n=1 Tax=Hyphomicrobium sp. 1Nfss2.1 TaxID=3413936 RepID=UPI003C79F07B
MQKKDRQHSLRLPSEVSEAIEKMASADSRSFSSMVEIALRDYIARNAKARGKR